MRVQHWMVVGLAIGAAACGSDADAPLAAGEVAAMRAAAPARTAPAAGSPTIVDVAVADGRFTTLVAAVQAAGLVEALSAVGQRTVFAPTDAAFAALPAGALDGLLAEPDLLREVLLYHVTQGRRDAADVTSSDRLRMLNGAFTTIRLEGGAAMIDDAVIVLTDVEASNGLIHVIDAVLVP
jgi:transforming growth factor-beta-induced protein